MIKVVREVGPLNVFECTPDGETDQDIKVYVIGLRCDPGYQYKDEDGRTGKFFDINMAIKKARELANTMRDTGASARTWMPRESFNHKPENKKQKV